MELPTYTQLLATLGRSLDAEKAPAMDGQTTELIGRRVLNANPARDGHFHEPCILNRQMCTAMIRESYRKRVCSREEREYRPYMNFILPWLVGARFLRAR